MNIRASKSIQLFAAFALAACSGDKNPEQAELAPTETQDVIELSGGQADNAGIRLGKVEERQISGVVRANGHLDVPPQQMVSVSAPLGGFLKSTTLLQGSKVARGQVIAVIENPDYIQLQQDYLEARNQLEYANADYTRQQDLAKDNVNAQKTLQQAKATYLNALARRNGLAAKLKLINIDFNSLEQGEITSTANLFSPIAGYVTAVNVNIGRFVSPSDELFTIVDTEHLHAELTIFEKDIPFIKVGQRIRFVLANEAKERTATVYLVGREIRADRTVTVHCHIDREDKDMLPGMYLKAVIETGGKLVTALPESAIIDYLGKRYFFIEVAAAHQSPASSHHYEMIEVSTGDTERGYVEVNLPESYDRDVNVVVEGAYSILSKMKNNSEEE
jgi:cobalt-zinc-cadmium efflux system membrane fusion protein